MKSPNEPIKEPSLPTQDETRRANVLREEMLSQFRRFGESLSIIREDVSGIKPTLEKLSEKVDVLESAVRTHTDTIRTNTQDIRSLEDAVHGNTEAIHGMKADFNSINQRLEVVEANVSS